MGKSLGHQINDELWESIKGNYESSDYSGAVVDTIFYLNKLLREKLATDKDGTQLIQYAFGGSEPKLKITDMITQTDKNIQKVIQKILEGIMLAIRNSHHHEKTENIKNSCNSIVLFIEYLIPFIIKAKSNFDVDEFIKSIQSDFLFSPDEEYATELIKTIPSKYYLEILKKSIISLDVSSLKKSQAFINIIINKLNPSQLNNLHEFCSDAMLKNSTLQPFIPFTIIFTEQLYNSISKISRLRFNNAIKHDLEYAKAINSGRITEYGGRLVYYMKNHIDLLSNFNEIMETLIRKLNSSNIGERNFVVKYFSNLLFDPSEKYFIKTNYIIIERLKSLDEKFYYTLAKYMEKYKDDEFDLIFPKYIELYELFLSIDTDSLKEFSYYENDDLPF